VGWGGTGLSVNSFSETVRQKATVHTEQVVRSHQIRVIELAQMPTETLGWVMGRHELVIAQGTGYRLTALIQQAPIFAELKRPTTTLVVAENLTGFQRTNGPTI
jgi:hypothetical protein